MGVEFENISEVIEESGGKGWNRKLRVDEMRMFNIHRWLVNT